MLIKLEYFAEHIFEKVNCISMKGSNSSLKKVKGCWYHNTQLPSSILRELDCSFLYAHHRQVLLIFLKPYEWKVFRRFSPLDAYVSHLSHRQHLCHCPYHRAGFYGSVNTHRFCQLTSRLSFVRKQNIHAQCACLLQNQASCDSKGKPPAGPDKDGFLVTGFLC